MSLPTDRVDGTGLVLATDEVDGVDLIFSQDRVGGLGVVLLLMDGVGVAFLMSLYVEERNKIRGLLNGTWCNVKQI